MSKHSELVGQNRNQILKEKDSFYIATPPVLSPGGNNKEKTPPILAKVPGNNKYKETQE